MNPKPFEKDVLNKLQVCQTCMGYEESIRVSYQSLLAALETILFSFAFALSQFQTTNTRVLAVPGVLLCAGFGTACEFRARNVDYWRKRIVDLAKSTDLADLFAESKYGWVPLGRAGRIGERLFGHWFERIVIPAIFLLWLWVLTW
jgi:hypothetical protein